MPHQYIAWRGNRVHVTEAGDGDPLLLITGLGGNTEMWTPFIERLMYRRIIRFDAPGTGLSSTPLFPIPVATLSDLVAAVLDACDVPIADVVGFSYGGAVAQQLAYDHPTRVRRLVLASTTCGMYGIPGRFDALAGLMTPLRYYSPSYYERTAEATFGGMTGRDSAARRRMMVARRRQPPSPYGYAMQLLGAMGWTSWPFLHHIPHETLVIAGDDDPLIPVANAEMLARRIPRAQLEIVEGAGHLFLWDDAADNAARIGRFLDPSRTDDLPADDELSDVTDADVTPPRGFAPMHVDS